MPPEGIATAMTVRSIMTADPATLRAEDTVGVAVDLLLDRRYILLPVVDADSRYLGEFDVWDLLGLLLPKAATLDKLVPDLGFIADDLPGLKEKFAALRGQPVGPLARTSLPHLEPDMPVTEALLLFYRQRSALPVVDKSSGRLVGVLSYWDALNAVAGA